jgi:hypothetical protein
VLTSHSAERRINIRLIDIVTGSTSARLVFVFCL